MARIDIKSSNTGGGGGGNLQLAGGASMTTTLTAVTDTSNVSSPLKLSTTAVQVTSPLRITTSDASGFYLDAEDSATNNRFSIKRDPSAQEVTLDFASNPSGSTTLVGAIRTFRDGTNLSNAMSFIEDGSIGVGTTAPIGLLDLYKAAAATRLAIRGDAGQNRLISYRTGAVQRFGLYVNNTAESGSNAGSNFAIRAYDDAGTLLSTPLFIERSTGNVGFGTTAPAGKLDIVSDGGGQLLFSRYGGQPQINIRRSQGTFAAPTAVTSGASSVLNFQNYDGTSFGTSAQIQSVPTENQTPTARGASLALNVVQTGTTSVINGLIVSGATTTPGSVSITTNSSAATARLSIWQTALSSTLPYFNIQETGGGELLEFSNAGNLLVGSGSPSDTARVSIKGSGATSATTSFLVQNSSAVPLMNITDAGVVKLGGSGVDGTLEILRSGDQAAVGRINQSSNVFQFQELSGIGYRFLDGFGGAPLYLATAKASVNKNAVAATCAQFEVVSTTGGVLFPRMTTAEKNAIASPLAGLVVFDTTLNKLCVYTTAWETITSI